MLTDVYSKFKYISQIFFIGHGKLIIYFYPKDATPGCTIEGHDFTKAHKKFKKLNTEILGVSRDSIASHERFKEKQGYSFDLLSDADEKLCAIFGAIKLKNMYGKMVRGINRSTFVIDEKEVFSGASIGIT